ncbi:MAG: hypothetical protein LBL17_05105 [Coxiellaceae bacterium]|jgi:hypothetical protein|nr:hypothetical protein [Coxiellaceae bacterium]
MYRHRLYNLIVILILGTFGIWPTINSAEKVMRDPTQPPSYINALTNTTSDTNITAIFVGENSQFTIINGHVFKVGDRIADAKIIAINIDGITLQNDDGSYSKIATSYTEVKIPITNKKRKNRENSD